MINVLQFVNTSTTYNSMQIPEGYLRLSTLRLQARSGIAFRVYQQGWEQTEEQQQSLENTWKP